MAHIIRLLEVFDYIQVAKWNRAVVSTRLKTSKNMKRNPTTNSEYIGINISLT